MFEDTDSANNYFAYIGQSTKKKIYLLQQLRNFINMLRKLLAVMVFIQKLYLIKLKKDIYA